MDQESGGLARWFVLLMGIGFLVFSVYIYRHLAGMEATGGSMRIHWLLAFVYNTMGKGGVSAVFVLFGAMFIWLFFKGDTLDE